MGPKTLQGGPITHTGYLVTPSYPSHNTISYYIYVLPNFIIVVIFYLNCPLPRAADCGGPLL